MRRKVMFFLAGALCIASLQAQEPRISKVKPNGVLVVKPSEAPPATLQKIFSNLGSSTNAYYPYSGWTLSGPDSVLGFEQFVSMPFTPTANAHVKQVRAAIGYGGAGADQVNISLYSDAGGIPGTLLAGPVTVTNLPTFGECCDLAKAVFPREVAVSAGVQYWVVADTPATGTGSDAYAAWNFVVTKKMYGINLGSGWFAYAAYTSEPAGAVYGTIP